MFIIITNTCKLTAGARIATRIVALTPSMKKKLWLKFGELRSRDVAIATDFVARNGDKLA